MTKRPDSKGNEYGAPWREQLPDGQLGPEYLPLSPRTGRAVAQSSAERDYAEGHGYVGSSGLWNHEQEFAEGSSSPAPTPERHDAEPMRRFVERHGNELTAHQFEVYVRFWREHRSYAATASLMGVTRKSISNAVLLLRRKLATSVPGSPPTTGYVQCPRCQAQTRVVKTKHRPGQVRRTRRCVECSHAFPTVESAA